VLPRAVWVLATVSLLNDAASEMIAPLLPVFLTATLGTGPAIVGLIEGAADAISSVLKLIAGRLADRGVSRRRLVIGGYTLANTARPLIGLAASWGHVFALRFVDRIGKGLRTAPRDALLAASVAPGLRGRAFGLQRSFDHLGAMAGPLVAAALLAADVPMRQVFVLAGVFGLLTVALLWFGLTEPRRPTAVVRSAPPLLWRTLDVRVRTLLVTVTVLAAATVPEVLIVLWATEHGLAVVWVPVLWAAAHAAKSFAAWRCGTLTDRLGAFTMLLVGWPLRIAALLALALADPSGVGVWLAFIGYCATLAATEPAERTLIAVSVPEAQRGTAYGWLHLLVGMAALPGALVIGVIWERLGSSEALLTAAAVSALACLAAALTARFGARTAEAG